ncbi:MAG: hypothetical protein CVU74_05150 [Deltaproteobacteria bacterium HGW-Deltaproteobacteria-9]|nr:MAG: hypothetical protein CVU74_05150 [Deltaproteobacteria bacterium HGW-Deltaproteobacteria-9]
MLNILQDLEAARMDAESTGHKVKAMSEAVNDALVMIDGQGKVLFWNRAAEMLFGYTATEAMGKDFHELAVPPEEIEKARAGVRKFGQTGQGILFGSAIETTAINRMGETFSVEVNLSPFQLGNDWFAVGTVRDITERKRADALKVGKEVAEEAAARAEEAAVQAEQARQEAERAQEELKVKLQEIERFNRLSLGRESRIIELKKQVNEIALKADGKPIYREQDITGDSDDIIQTQSLANGLDQAEIPPQAIAEMLNVDKFQRLLEDFCDSVGIASAIIDLQGTVIASARWQRACTDFHRVNEKTCVRCIESDTELALNLNEGKNFSVYRCKNGLTDAASPIIVEGKHVANTFVGQFFTSLPDMDYFRRQAEECGLDVEQYLAAIRDVPVVAENKLEPVLGFLVGVAQTVAAMSMERNRAKQAESSIAQQIEMIKRERTSAMSLAEDADNARTELERYKDNLELLIQERTDALKLAGQEQVAIFESLTLGIAFVKDRIILRGNAKLGELFGRSLDEMIGQTTRIWYSSDEEYSGIGASTYEDLKTKPIHQREQLLPRKDGSLFWCLFRVRALDAQDIAQGIVCTLEDITERKEAEKELKERMEELERFSRLTINREEKMIQLKEEINSLLEKTGREKKYKIVE